MSESKVRLRNGTSKEYTCIKNKGRREMRAELEQTSGYKWIVEQDRQNGVNLQAVYDEDGVLQIVKH